MKEFKELKMTKNYRKYWISVALAAFVLMAHSEAGETSTVGPHGGIIATSGKEKVEVSIDQSKKKVHVYVIQKTKEFPGSIGIALRNDKGQETVLELKTIDPDRNPLHYSTSLVGGNQSFVGFEIKIPFGRQPPLIFRSHSLH